MTIEDAAVATTRLLTYDDLLETPDDRRRYEIIGGRLIVSSVPVLRHQKLSGRLSHPLFALEKAGLGEVYTAPIDVRLFEHDIVVPDLIFIVQDRLPLFAHEERFIDGSPDLIFEILSSETRAVDLGPKHALYAAAGIAEYWKVSPHPPDVTALALVDSQYVPIPAEGGVIRSRVLPEFAVDIAALFAELR